MFPATVWAMPHRVRRPLSLRSWVGAVAAATSLALLMWTGSANGQPVPLDEPQILVEVPLVTVNPQTSSVITIDSGYSIDISTTALPSEIASGCHSTQPASSSTVTGSLCLGNVTSGQPLQVSGYGDAAGLFKQTGAQTALGWMVEEGIAYVRAAYDVPDDARVERYARPQLRSYVTTRLLDIMKKAHDGISLSENETRALAFLRQQIRADDVALASATATEYRRFEANPCGYSPPAAPAGVTDPVRKPAAVVKDCNRPHSALETLFGFLPPKPSVAEFNAWGAYKTADQTSLGLLTNATYQESVRGLVTGLTVGAGVAAALGAAGIAAAVVGSSASLAATVGAITGTYAATGIFAAKLGAAAPAILGGVAAASAAAVIGIVIFAAVVIAISIWMLVENESIGTKILDAEQKARSVSDPLDVQGSKLYESDDFITRLAGKVAAWTTLDDFRQAIPDSYRAVSPDAQTLDDFTFTRSEAGGPAVDVGSIAVRQQERTVDLHFNQDWMIAKESTRANAYPVLSFGFTGTDGKQHLASRAPRFSGGTPRQVRGAFIVTTPGAGGAAGVRTDTIEMVEPGSGKVVRIGIKPPAAWKAVGPRPSAGGAMFTNRTVFFRPNPVAADGSFDFTHAQTDYDYAWTLWRQDEATTQWAQVPLTAPATYGPSFVPTQMGVYEARVAMTRKVPGSQATYGSVRFTVNAPPIQVAEMSLIDDGYHQLEIDAKLTSPTMSDSYQVAVQWPGKLDGTAGPVSTITMPCYNTEPAICETVRTTASHLLTRAITDDTDLRQPVTVTVTGSQGTTLTRSFAIGDPSRPAAIPPTAGDNAGARGSVLVEEGITQVEVPVGTSSYANYVIARLKDGTDFPGTGFGLIEPSTGVQKSAIDVFGDGSFVARAYQDPVDHEWKLVMSGVPYPSRIGVREVPLIIRQGSTQTLIRLRVSVVAATQDRYRGVVLSDVDPLNFGVAAVPSLEPTVLGGRSEWGSWAGDICVGLEAPFGVRPPAYCAPAASFRNADGTPKDFPWARLKPDGLGTGTYRASAWLPGDPKTDAEPVETSFLLTKGAVVATRPAIAGAARVGSVATVVPGGWAATPGISFAYQWLREGAPIPGATGAAYEPGIADLGRGLSVRMTGTVPGWAPATATSAPVGVGLGVLPLQPKPKAGGTPKAGKKLKVKPGSWGSGVTLAYRWHVGGKAVKAKKGAKATLKLTRAMRGKKVYVVVTATRPGYSPVVVRSAAKKVR